MNILLIYKFININQTLRKNITKSFNINLIYKMDKQKQKVEQTKQLQHLKTTNLFKLYAALSEDTLTIQLHDMQDWTIYRKTYTNEDIGRGQIHMKASLQQLHMSLEQANTQNDIVKMKKEFDENGVQIYSYGTVFDLDNFKFYKVEKGGKLTIYVNNINAINKKVTICESTLQLQKHKTFTISQIKHQKQKYERNLNQKKLFEQIDQLKNQNTNLTRQLQRVKQQNRRIDGELKTANTAIQDIRRQFQGLKGLVNGEFVKINNSAQVFRNKVEGDLTNVKKKVQSVDLSLRECARSFKVHNNIITNTGQHNTNNQYIFPVPIAQNSTYTFRVKVLKIQPDDLLTIGIVDENKQRNQRYSYKSNNAICLQGESGNVGRKYPGAEEVAVGFVEGDVVEVKVNMGAKEVTWSCFGELKATIKADILAEQGRAWKPYFESFQRGTQVQWFSND